MRSESIALFTGFPSYWNIVVFYLWLARTPPAVNASASRWMAASSECISASFAWRVRRSFSISDEGSWSLRSMSLIALLQAAETLATEPAGDWVDSMLTFLDTPAPYSPLTEYLAVLFLLWLLARRTERKKESFDRQAQDVLDRKLAEGELTEAAYQKFRQDLIIRPKR